MTREQSGTHSIRLLEVAPALIKRKQGKGTNPMRFGSKAETLHMLASHLTTARVLPQIRFTVGDWQEDPTSILAKVIESGWLAQGIIVRSSSLAEDHANESQAGKYCSVGHVQKEEQLVQAVRAVIQSYGASDAEDQVFIQPMLSQVTMSGVVFSHDPNTGAPYFVINYDEVSGSTDRVTSGQSNELKTVYLYKHFKGHTRFSPEILRVVALLQELELLFRTDRLDVEFAWAEGQLYLLQVRPLVLQTQSISEDLQPALQRIATKVKTWNRPHPLLHGSRTVFGVMPDWNPAEIIGIRPRPLAMSLYKEIVTDRIWAQQRCDYGYKNVVGVPLLIDFCGLPYVDVRASFNSFLPATLDSDLSEKLVDHYLFQLIDSPAKHDKVEFEIVYSCYTFDLQDRMNVLLQHGFSEGEIKEIQDRLHALTQRIIGPQGYWLQDLEKIKFLQERYAKVVQSDLGVVEKIYWLLEDCKQYGTLPFAGLARAGFVAVQLLQSLVQVGIMSPDDYDLFMKSLSTVSSKMARHFHELDQAEFLRRYGHLRPGTYDILSARYDEDKVSYFDWHKQGDVGEEVKEEFSWTPAQRERLEQLLHAHEFEHDADSLLKFLKAAIEGREYAKFVFSKSLSDAISLFEQLAAEYGFTAEDASYANISSVLAMYGSSVNLLESLAKNIQEGIEKHELTKRLLLPPLISDESDVWAFEVPPFEPNFVTQKRALGPVAFVTDRDRLENSIVFIESADPGYDWIFTKGIAGFVTLFGGANSHMSIRASELGIPAVIGTGESLYRRWSKAEVIEMDCLNRQVRIIK